MRHFFIMTALGGTLAISPVAAQEAQKVFEGIWQYSANPNYGALKIEGSEVEFYSGDGMPGRCGRLVGRISASDAVSVSGSWSGQCEDLSAIGHFSIRMEGSAVTMTDCLGLASEVPSCELGTYYREVSRAH